MPQSNSCGQEMPKAENLVFIIAIVRKARRITWVKWVLILLTVYLLLGVRNVYRAQEVIMREIIFNVVGADRNTSEKVLPLVDTTIISPSHNCQFAGKNVRAVIVVPTLPEHRDRRELIRRTWGANRYDAGMMLFFFSGRHANTDLEMLTEEAELHGDLIVDNLEENYYALTTKTLRILKWFSRNCPRAQFVVKADDDVFLNLPLFAKLLDTQPEGFQIGGRVLEGRTPNLRNPFSKWYTPWEMWPEGTIAPTYIGGPCYVIRGGIVPKLLHAACATPLYHLEDVFLTGMVASQRLGIELSEFPGTLDPKYPWLSYWSQKYFSFSGGADTITSFHTDGTLSLVKRFYEDFEISSALRAELITYG